MIQSELVTGCGFTKEESITWAVTKINTIIELKRIEKCDIIEYKTTTEFSCNKWETTIILTLWK